MIFAHSNVFLKLVGHIGEAVQRNLNSIAVPAMELPSAILRRNAKEMTVLSFLDARLNGSGSTKDSPNPTSASQGSGSSTFSSM